MLSMSFKSGLVIPRICRSSQGGFCAKLLINAKISFSKNVASITPFLATSPTSPAQTRQRRETAKLNLYGQKNHTL